MCCHQRKDPVVTGMEVEEKPEVSYDQIGGLEEQVREVKRRWSSTQKPELFEKIGIEPPKGVLLYGPPGTGKTLLAKAVAHETNATFIKIVASEFVRKYMVKVQDSSGESLNLQRRRLRASYS